MSKKFLAMMAFLMGSTALACPGASLKLNDDTELTGAGVYDVSENKLYPYSFYASRGKVGKKINITDSADRKTHAVIILGQHSDSQGVFFTSYLVKELSSGEEKTYILYTNYAGNGSSYRGLPPADAPATTPDSNFRTLETSGCGG